MEIKYIFTSLTTSLETGVVASGPLILLVCVSILCCVGASLRMASIHIPHWLSKFGLAFTLGSVLDPLLVGVVDVLSGNFMCPTRAGCKDDYTSESCHCVEGDAFKLWTRMSYEGVGAVVGLIYTILLYVGTTLAALMLGYVYVFFIHMNGRMMDLYERIHSPR